MDLTLLTVIYNLQHHHLCLTWTTLFGWMGLSNVMTTDTLALYLA